MIGWVVAILAEEPVDVYRLDIGPKREVEVRPGWTDTQTGKSVSPTDVAKSARDVQFVLMGESHDHTGHKVATAELIRALVADGRQVILGLEMFTRPNQPNLDPWTMGYWDQPTFQAKTNWSQEWGFDYAIYKPAFDVVRELRIPMVALNVPRTWVRAVGRGGKDALPEEAKGQVPAIDTTNRFHRLVFESLLGGHPTGGTRMDQMYAAQVLWDAGMADTALKAMKRWPTNPNRVMVILCGSGHAMYGQGINYRLMQQARARSVTVIGLEGTSPRRVRVGLGEFVFMGPK